MSCFPIMSLCNECQRDIQLHACFLSFYCPFTTTSLYITWPSFSFSFFKHLYILRFIPFTSRSRGLSSLHLYYRLCLPLFFTCRKSLKNVTETRNETPLPFLSNIQFFFILVMKVVQQVCLFILSLIFPLFSPSKSSLWM